MKIRIQWIINNKLILTIFAQYIKININFALEITVLHLYNDIKSCQKKKNLRLKFGN